MSYANKNNSKNLAPLALIGALGVVGYLAYDYLSSNGGSYNGGSGGGASYFTPDGSPLMAAGGYTPIPATSAADQSSFNPYSTNDGTQANAQFITESKKEQITTSSDSLLRSAVSGASYTQLTSADIAAYNASLLNSIQKEDRTGGGSVSSALAFMGIGEGARYVATIPNTAGISNAGANLTSVVYDSGAYEVRDFRGNIVGSGSAGSVQAINTATKKEEKTTASAGGVVSTPYTTVTLSGGGTYSAKSGSAYSYGGGGSSSSTKKETATEQAISKPFTTATLSSGGTYSVKSGSAYSYSGGGSSSSSKKSTVSSGGYAQGGAVRSNTTTGKYTGKK